MTRETVHTKEDATIKYNHYSDYHYIAITQSLFRAIVKSQIERFYRICENNQNFDDACTILFSVLMHSGYAPRYLLKIKSDFYMHRKVFLLNVITSGENLVQIVGVVVQWLDHSPVTQEPDVRFPAYCRESGVFKRGTALVDME